LEASDAFLRGQWARAGRDGEEVLCAYGFHGCVLFAFDWLFSSAAWNQNGDQVPKRRQQRWQSLGLKEDYRNGAGQKTQQDRQDHSSPPTGPLDLRRADRRTLAAVATMVAVSVKGQIICRRD
jgi:hypothetical protein